MSRRRRDEGEDYGYGHEEEEEEEEEYGGRGGGGGGSRRGGGFAAMPKEKVRAIAAKGGRVSGRRRREESEEEEEEGRDREEEEEESEEGEEEEERGYGYGYGRERAGGRRGFAAMPREKVRAIAAKGGRASGRRRREESEEEEGDRRRTRRRREEEEEEGEGYGEEGGYGRRGRVRDTYATGPSQTVRRMYERGERKPRHSLREEDQGVGYLEDEESLEDRMGYFGKGARKGFAAMPRERVREIAAKGGRHSHGFKSKARYAEGGMEEVPAREEQRGGYYRVGFAAMPRERVREIARKGGRHSHGYGEEEGGDEYQLGEEDREHYPMLMSLGARSRRAY